MALRITKKDIATIKELNTRAKRKASRLSRTYGLRGVFTIRNLASFTTRKELNAYKKSINNFLLRTTHHYRKGGTYISYRKGDYGNVYHYPIPMSDVKEINDLIRRRNRYVENQRKRFERVTYDVKGKKQDITLNDRFRTIVNPNFKKLGATKGSYFPIKFQPQNISSRQALVRFKYALKNFQTPESITKKQHQAKLNYIEALANTFGGGAMPIINILEQMTDREFIEFFESEDFAEFGYIYDPELASEVIQYLTKHLVNYLSETKTHVSENAIDVAEFASEMDSSILLAQHNVGSLGGQRVMFGGRDGKRKTTWYIDLNPEEYEEYLRGKSVTDFENFETRRKQLNLYRYR